MIQIMERPLLELTVISPPHVLWSPSMTHHVELQFPTNEESARPTSWADLPLWACGFRPFFLGGALLAATSILAWVFIFFGGISIGGPAGPIGWHAHEMIFGFAPAIIAGFLLTAVPKWTRTASVSGLPLAGLFAIWCVGRVAMALSAHVPYPVVAALDLLFLPALAVAISIPIVGARTPRNFGFIPLLMGLAAANAVFHLAHLGVLDGWSSRALDAGLAVIITIIAIVGGRVIPFFTTNRLSLSAISRRRAVDLITIATTVAWLISLVIWPHAWWTGLIALVAGTLNLARMWGWKGLRTPSVPLLWVLHVGYAFVGIGLIALGLAVLEITATRSIALHALTTGAIGILCLGMMARVSLGHSGRPLKAHPITAIAFGLITLAAIVRVFLPWLLPSLYTSSIWISVLLWTLAWVLFLFIYAPILLRRRADGRPG